MAYKHGKEGIRFVTVSPGVILTDMGKAEGQLALDSAAQSPLGRPGRPEEIGQVIGFLASEKASYVTACDVPVDGGAINAVVNK